MDNTLHNLYAARFAAAEAVSAYKGVFGDLLFSLMNKDTPTLIPDMLSAYHAENGLDGDILHTDLRAAPLPAGQLSGRQSIRISCCTPPAGL